MIAREYSPGFLACPTEPDPAVAQAQRQLDALLLWAFNRSKAKYQQPRNPAGSLFRPWNRKSD